MLILLKYISFQNISLSDEFERVLTHCLWTRSSLRLSELPYVSRLMFTWVSLLLQTTSWRHFRQINVLLDLFTGSGWERAFVMMSMGTLSSAPFLVEADSILFTTLFIEYTMAVGGNVAMGTWTGLGGSAESGASSNLMISSLVMCFLTRSCNSIGNYKKHNGRNICKLIMTHMQYTCFSCEIQTSFSILQYVLYFWYWILIRQVVRMH